MTSADRIELLYGQIIPMSPVGRFHAACVSRVQTYFIASFPKEFTFRTKDPITILPKSEPEPDFIIANYDPNFYIEGHPKPSDVVLLIEVSDSTLDKDRTYKLPLYAAEGIKEYWIINLAERQIEIYTLPNEEGEYENCTICIESETIDHPQFGQINTLAFLPSLGPPRMEN